MSRPQTFTRSAERLGCWALPIISLAAASANGQSVNWRNALNGSFGVGSNWVGGTPPGVNATAVFGLTGSVTPFSVSFAANVTNAGLTVSSQRPSFNLGGRTYNITGDTAVGGLNSPLLTITNGVFNPRAGGGVAYVGRLAGQSGEVVLGAGAVCSGIKYVGYGGAGTLNLRDGAVVNQQDGQYFVIGTNPGSNGSAVVSGAATRLNVIGGASIVAGQDGTGSLRVEAGAAVTTDRLAIASGAGIGAVVITGPGSRLSSLGTDGRIGTNGPGQGVMIVELGGAFSHGVFMHAGSGAGARGDILVIDAGSTFASPQLHLGDGGTGALDVEDGGVVTCPEVIDLCRGSAQSRATLTVRGAGSLVTTGYLRSNAGGLAEVRVEGGGRLEVAHVIESWSPGTRRNWVVDGPGTMVTAGELFRVAGEGATETVQVQNQAVVTANGGWIRDGGIFRLSGGGGLETAHDLGISGTRTQAAQLRIGAGSYAFVTGRVDLGNRDINGGDSLLTMDGGDLYCMDYVPVSPYGVVEGRGSIYGHISVEGLVRPGLPIGALRVNSAVFAAGGRLAIELANGQHDRLEVAHSVDLNGTMAVTLADGFVPVLGQTFDVIVPADGTGGRVFGRFSRVLVPDMGNGLAFLTEYLSSAVRLHVASLTSITPSAAQINTTEGFTPVMTASARMDALSGLSVNTDVTDSATWVSDDPGVLAVLGPGRLAAGHAGDTNLRIRLSGVEAVIPVHVDPLAVPPTLSNGLDGVLYDLYQPNFPLLTPYRTATLDRVGLQGLDRHANVGIVFTGRLRVPSDGVYTLRNQSDDGSRVFLDGEQVLNNSGVHGCIAAEAELTLSAGDHDVAVEFYQVGGGECVRLDWRRVGSFDWREIAGSDWASGVRADYYAVSYPPLPNGMLDWTLYPESKRSVISRIDWPVVTFWSPYGQAWSGPTGLRASGFLYVPQSGQVTFAVQAKFMAQLRLDGMPLIETPFNSDTATTSATVQLEAGFHPIAVDAWCDDRWWGLRITANGAGFMNQPLDAGMLYHGELPCIGDYNADGGIDGNDVGAFFADWEAGNAPADVNTDGGIDGADVQFFFAHWEGGC